MHPVCREVATLAPSDRRYKIFRVIASRGHSVSTGQIVIVAIDSGPVIAVGGQPVELRQASNLVLSHLLSLHRTDHATISSKGHGLLIRRDS